MFTTTNQLSSVVIEHMSEDGQLLTAPTYNGDSSPTANHIDAGKLKLASDHETMSMFKVSILDYNTVMFGFQKLRYMCIMNVF